MRAKARRMLSLALLIAGAQAAYPQISFPDNLQNSTVYWEELVSFPLGNQQEYLFKQWNQLSNRSLSTTDFKYLENVLNLTGYQISKLPKEEKQFLFKYQHLAIHLSGMNPSALGSSDRAGVWMLTYPAARRYGLIVNDQVDERRDLVKSTQAARSLFKDLKNRHGANAETMFVLGAAGWKHTSEKKILEIEENLAALRLLSKSFDGNRSLQADANWIPQLFDGKVSITALSLELGLDDSQFHHMNPTLIGRYIPAGTEILIPSAVDGHNLIASTMSMERLHRKQQDSIVNRIKRNIPSPQSHQVVSYRVKSGDVLGKIAERYGVRVSKIKKWNNLRSDRIDINQKLTIYYPKGKKIPKKAVAKTTPKPEVKLIAKEIGKFTIYEVQPGDTLWAISKKFSDVKPEDIMAWNAIGENLSIGQKLKIKTLN